jgi:uncharacterized protein
MKLQRFTNVAAFRDRAIPFLLEYEAEDNLILGLSSALLEDPHRYGPDDPYLATVEKDDSVVAVVLRTPPHNLLISRVNTHEVLPLIANEAQQFFGKIPGVNAMSETSKAFAELWQNMTGQSFKVTMAQRVYKLEKVIPAREVSGHIRRAEQKDRDLLVDWVIAFSKEAIGQDAERGRMERSVDLRLTHDTTFFNVWEDNGQVVSLVGSSGPTPNGIRIGPVYTPPEQRGKGYASACVAAFSQFLLDGGRKFVFLYTDLSNPTSNRIYQNIGYNAVCDTDQYEFSE